MFGGTGVFLKQPCPFMKSLSKNSANPPAGSVCGRPHCKYSHEAVVQGGNVPLLQRSSSAEFPSLVPDFPAVEAAFVDQMSSHVSATGFEMKETATEGEMQQSVTNTAMPFETSPSNVQRNEILPLSTQAIVSEKPSYSDTPSYPSDEGTNFYHSSSAVDRVNEMEYDPVANWSLTGVRTGTLSTLGTLGTTVKEEPMEPTTLSATLPQNVTAAATIRNRMANSDALIALGRKPAGTGSRLAAHGAHGTGGLTVPNGSVKRPLSPGGSTSSGKVGGLLGQPKRRMADGLNGSSGPNGPKPSTGPDGLKPVKKRAKFGRSAEDDESMEVEEVRPVGRVKRDSADQAEIMKHLFGDEDEDDDTDVVLPIEMPAQAQKTVPRGFPKNPEKLLQTMAAATAQETARSAPAVGGPRPLPPPRKKAPPTPQQQLEMRAKALEEQRKKVAAGTSGTSGTSGTLGTLGSSATSLETVDKGNKRIAHQVGSTGGGMTMPRVAIIPGRTNLQLQFRQQVLEKFVQLMSQIYTNPVEVAERAIQTEIDIAKVSFHVGTYRNKCTQELAKLKDTVSLNGGPVANRPNDVKTSPTTSSTSGTSGTSGTLVRPQGGGTTVGTVQKQLVAGTPQRPFSGDPKYWSDQDFHTAMRKYLIREDELVTEGYPLIQGKKQADGENRRDGLQLYIAMSGKITPDRVTKTLRNCCRCKKEFTVDFEGNYVGEEECTYHWGKSFSRRVSGEGVASKRSCCGDDASSLGCCVAKCHVADTIPSMSGFVSSQGVKPLRPEQRFGVYAIDCEMIYTVGGMEVARVTVVDRMLKCVYETLVRPKQKIVDCNTRFSGLKMEMFMKGEGQGQGGVKSTSTSIKTIEEVHRDLLGGLINEETVLIGHSLESDLLAMKFIHRNIVDTSLVFPHKRGRPFKRALRNLMRELLQKIIQEDVGGHDSREDAAACMELMVWKLRQDPRRML